MCSLHLTFSAILRCSVHFHFVIRTANVNNQNTILCKTDAVHILAGEICYLGFNHVFAHFEIYYRLVIFYANQTHWTQARCRSWVDVYTHGTLKTELNVIHKQVHRLLANFRSLLHVTLNMKRPKWSRFKESMFAVWNYKSISEFTLQSILWLHWVLTWKIMYQGNCIRS